MSHSHESMSQESSYRVRSAVFKIQNGGRRESRVIVNSVVRYATSFVSRIHFNRRTSSEVEIIQRTLVTAKDLGIFLLKWVGKDVRLLSTAIA